MTLTSPLSFTCCLAPLLALAAAAAAAPRPAARRVVPLDAGWQLRQSAAAPGAIAAEWLTAEVPGCVHLDLLRHKLIDEPFYRDNEAKLQWIEKADWEYRTTIQADAALLARTHIELVFEGLDAYAEVSLNGTPLLTANNMFRLWRVDAKRHLRSGANELRILFPSPLKAAAAAAATDPRRTLVRAEEKTYVRKAAYEYGWDWGPRFVTSGVWRPARLEAWDVARIADFHIRQRDVTPALARLVAELEIVASADAEAELRLDLGDAHVRHMTSKAVRLHAGLNRIDLPLEVDAPALWYPNGYGAQPLYDARAALSIGKAAVDTAGKRVGLRTVALRREVDRWGRSFELLINGIPVFAKGADVIPFDSFPTRVTTAQYRRVLESARDANMNMIRHWGGGYYESDEFYALCDELGILVWQDFMFGNDWQPGTYDFKLNVAAEAEDQLRRLRDHPSIVLFCGNNETESAFTWGERKTAPPEARLRMWQDYLTLFSGVLARAVERFAPETPFWPSSPSADYEDTSAEYQSGDAHDWSVWHGKVPFADYEKNHTRFMTEYGFQSFPELSTVETYTAPEDRATIFSDVMQAHQKSGSGNALIREYMLRDYSEPRDFASFLYASQVLQAEGIKIGAEHLRRNRPRAMGSLYWQLNDCWPVASWSSLDYYGRWKALHYYARRFYSPLLVTPHVEHERVAVYVVSDKPEPTRAALRVRLLDTGGAVLSDQSAALEIPPLSSDIYAELPLATLPAHDPSRTFVAADLLIAGRLVSRNLVYLVPVKGFVLPPATIERELRAAGSAYRLRLSSPALARSVYVSFGALDAQVSDNYFDLLPGEPLEIEVSSAASREALQAALRVVSLVDAFPPSADASH